MQDCDGSVNLVLGVKGVVYFELESSGKSWGRGPKDFAVHSANKAWVDSPVWRLVHALKTMTSDDGNNVLIDCFYDDVAPLSAEDEEVVRAAAKNFDPKSTKDSMKVDKFIIPDGDGEALIRLYTTASTLNIDGIWAGWIEKGSKTVLPHQATCKMDIRVVPNQKKDNMMPLVRKHLDRHGYKDIKMTEIDTGYDWCRSSIKEPVVQAVLKSVREFSGEPNVWPSSGGSLPLFVFNRILGMPFAIGGIGYGDLAHSPNEFMVVEGNKTLAGLAEVEKFQVHFMNESAHAR
jgi:acetylornithine deacetylase/succinyl-diaminopimelate desuccinylase-like protein